MMFLPPLMGACMLAATLPVAPGAQTQDDAACPTFAEPGARRRADRVRVRR